MMSQYMEKGLNVCTTCEQLQNTFYCKQCASQIIQKRHTMLSALQADMKVLSKRTETIFQSSQVISNAEEKLRLAMKRVEILTEKILKTRERLCTERIAFVQSKSNLEIRSDQLITTIESIHELRKQAIELQGPLLDCLERQVFNAKDQANHMRANKIRQIFAFFQLSNESNQSKTIHFRTIGLLPLPISGHYEIVPAEIIAAGIGKVIQLLQSLIPYLRIEYPHTMTYNGSFSTILRTSREDGSMNQVEEMCQSTEILFTLYPDGSKGFEQGILLLHENIVYLCQAQGVDMKKIHDTDLLGNLLSILTAPKFGCLCDRINLYENTFQHHEEVTSNLTDL